MHILCGFLLLQVIRWAVIAWVFYSFHLVAESQNWKKVAIKFTHISSRESASQATAPNRSNGVKIINRLTLSCFNAIAKKLVGFYSLCVTLCLFNNLTEERKQWSHLYFQWLHFMRQTKARNAHSFAHAVIRSVFCSHQMLSYPIWFASWSFAAIQFGSNIIHTVLEYRWIWIMNKHLIAIQKSIQIKVHRSRMVEWGKNAVSLRWKLIKKRIRRDNDTNSRDFHSSRIQLAVPIIFHTKIWLRISFLHIKIKNHNFLCAQLAYGLTSFIISNGKKKNSTDFLFRCRMRNTPSNVQRNQEREKISTEKNV